MAAGESIAARLILLLIQYRDRTDPSGYKVSTIAFTDGEPTAPADSNTSYTDIFANADNSACPGNCFRPVGIAFDTQGRMFVSSDSTGEIYVVVKDEISNSTFGASGNGGSAGGSPESGGKSSDAVRASISVSVVLLALPFIYLTI